MTHQDWRDDLASDERWNAGLDYAMTQLCELLGVDQNAVTWDAATETLDGDVRAVLGNILRAKYGENWGPRDAVNSLPALVKALEDIGNIVAASPSSSDHDRLHAALDALDKARDIARAALASHKTGG